ncbi:MAG: polyribonucleotide nucleotidyltransferase [Minisyncoccia bacterium]
MEQKKYTVDIGGRTLTAEFNDLADQAHGSVMLTYGESVVLATAVMGEEKQGLDYFPLSVEFEERFYAAGAILGSQFIRREGRPSDEGILSGRVVDRTIRPLFNQSLRREVQVIITVLALGADDADVLGIIGASLALSVSPIPWNGPVGAVRIGQKIGTSTLIVNPTYDEKSDDVSNLDLLACGKDGMINMIEVGSREVGEDILMQGLSQSAEIHTTLQKWQEAIIREIGKQKIVIEEKSTPEEVIQLFTSEIKPKLEDAVFGVTDGTLGKKRIGILKKEFLKIVSEQNPDAIKLADHYYEHVVDAYIHEEAMSNNRRADGRGFEEVRPLFGRAGGISPVLHGTGIFYRGATHVLSVLTLGGPGDAQLIDSMESRGKKKRFMHHYNFPPYSVGEAGRVGGTNRRMIGHGALAEKSLSAVLPAKEIFPYTIRIVSECVASNGSTSMGSVCASTIALMDAGVPISRPVAGIAMGLMSESFLNNPGARYKVLTDIQGPEDHHGDMDFKVAGTTEGVTGVQMDVKVDGIPLKVLSEAFVQAKKARLQILEAITTAIPQPRQAISGRAPEILTMKIKVEQIGLVIGPGGKSINGIRDESKVSDITIEEDGTIFITGTNGSAQRAREMVEALTREYAVGDKFVGEVTRIEDFGAFVRLAGKTEGMVHISEIAPFRIDQVNKALSLGEKVPVMIVDIDERKRIRLSIKAADPEFALKKGLNPAPRTEHGGSTGRQ